MTLPLLRLDRILVRVAVGVDVDDRVTIEGIMREPDAEAWLCPLLLQVHQAAVERRVGEVVLDLRRLGYANAALWKCLVYWLRLMRHEHVARYGMRVLTKPGCRWQRVGAEALGKLSADRFIVE